MPKNPPRSHRPAPSPPRRPGQPGPDEAKLTLILPKSLVLKTKHRAVDEGTSIKAIVLRALESELARPL
jgi:hypothetical protein